MCEAAHRSELHGSPPYTHFPITAARSARWWWLKFGFVRFWHEISARLRTADRPTGREGPARLPPETAICGVGPIGPADVSTPLAVEQNRIDARASRGQAAR